MLPITTWWSYSLPSTVAWPYKSWTRVRRNKKQYRGNLIACVYGFGNFLYEKLTNGNFYEAVTNNKI